MSHGNRVPMTFPLLCFENGLLILNYESGEEAINGGRNLEGKDGHHSGTWARSNVGELKILPN